jgi:hypothetical protein
MMKRMKPSTFKWLDAIFWAIWLLMPFLIWQAFDLTWSQPYSYEENYIGSPNVATYSTLGKVLVGLAAGTDRLFDLIILALMHRLVRQFKRGDLLIETTLSTIKYMAWAIIAMPIVEILIFNLNSYLLYRLGDTLAWQPLYTFKVMVFAMGLFLYALYMLIQHAIALQKDVDLTV